MGKMATQYSSSSTVRSSCWTAHRESCERSIMDKTVTSFSVSNLNSPLSWRMHETLLHEVVGERRSLVEGRLTIARGETARPLSHSITFPTLMMFVGLCFSCDQPCLRSSR